MEITKIINNNVVSGLDESGRETIWIGTGIGFHYKTEGVFDESIIQKKFHLEDSEAVSKFAGIAAISVSPCKSFGETSSTEATMEKL